MARDEPKRLMPGPFLHFDNLSSWQLDPSTASIAKPPSNRPLQIVLLILALGFPLTLWQIGPSPVRVPAQLGFDLRASAPVPKFNKTSAEAVPSVELPLQADKRMELVPEPMSPMGSNGMAIAVPVVQTVTTDFKEPGTLTPVVFHAAGSLACSCFHGLHQGDTPMIRNWNVIKFSALTAAALALTPVTATAQSKEEGKSIKDVVDSLQSQLDNMRTLSDKRHNDLLSAFTGIISDLDAIKRDLKSLGTVSGDGNVTLATAQARIKELENQVAALQKKMGEARVSGSSPTDLGVGKIQMVNMYSEDMLFVINGKTHRVAPYTTTTLDNQPAGTFIYEVISGTYGVRGTNRPVLEAGKTYTITVR